MSASPSAIGPSEVGTNSSAASGIRIRALATEDKEAQTWCTHRPEALRATSLPQTPARWWFIDGWWNGLTNEESLRRTQPFSKQLAEAVETFGGIGAAA